MTLSMDGLDHEKDEAKENRTPSISDEHHFDDVIIGSGPAG